MRMRDSEIMGLPTFTKSGDRLGTVADMIVDVETHVVVQYVVSRSRFLPSMAVSELLVGRAQVVTIDRERLVVEDAVVEQKAAAAQLATADGGAGSGGTVAASITEEAGRTSVTEG